MEPTWRAMESSAGDRRLDRTAHRPWPLPRGPWVMAQTWRELLFAHWPVPRHLLRPLVPAALDLEEHGGSAWVGLTPFLVTGLRARGMPPLPVLSRFPELNLRTYVRAGDRPGVFFFSLDAGSRLAVLGARIAYRLPYFPAEMEIERSAGWIRYRSRRRGDPRALFEGRYRPLGPPANALRGSLEHFLVERYALYASTPRGRLLRAEIHHPPWSLRRAEARIERNGIAASRGIALPAAEPLLHYSERQDTLVWPPERVR